MGSTDVIVYGVPGLRIKPQYIQAALELLIERREESRGAATTLLSSFID